MATRITQPIRNAFIQSPMRTRERVFLLYAQSVKVQTGDWYRREIKAWKSRGAASRYSTPKMKGAQHSAPLQGRFERVRGLPAHLERELELARVIRGGWLAGGAGWARRGGAKLGNGGEVGAGGGNVNNG